MLDLSPDLPLDKAAAAALDLVLTGLQEGLTDEKKMTEFLQQDTLVELVRIFVAQAAETPQMLVDGSGTSSAELRVIVSGIASAMAADDKFRVLGKDGWLQVAEVALGLAARNPGRLFGLKMGDPRQELAAVALSTLLTSAKETLGKGRKNGGVLFGDTLKQAMFDTLEMIASEPDKAAQAFGLDAGGANVVAEMIAQINQIVSLADSQKRYPMGSGDWLVLYRHALADLFSSLGIADTAPGLRHVTCKPTSEGALALCQLLSNKRLRFVDLVEATSPPRLTPAGEKFIKRYLS
jgi:hypothetical protein